jgi:oligopeptidase A
MTDNPLLEPGRLPAFGRIRPEHVEPAIDALIAANRATIRRLLSGPGPAGWSSLVEPLEEQDDRLNRAWSPVSHLHSVADNEALRRAYGNCLPKLADYGTEVGQNAELFGAYRAIAASDEFARLSAAQRKVIDNALRDFRLSGVDLPPADRERFRKIQQSLSLLQTRFEENVLDATQGWTRHIADPALLAGLPDSARALAAEAARQRGLPGWLFTLEFPSYFPVLQYADAGELRREMYEAYVTRASDRGPCAGRWDNGGVMAQILALRRELAELLGYATYAHLSLEKRMAKSPAEVMTFLRDLARRSRPVARAEFAELERFCRDRFGVARLDAWDVPYYSEKLRQSLYDFSEEELRPYFPASGVVAGMFDVVNRLYGIRINERAGVDTWHPDVRFFDIEDEAGTLRGSFYLDLYARAHKRGGAWMDDCVVRRRTGAGVQHPVAYLVCNFTPPVGGEPALLTHDEVMTLFHEFGHGLHHMLTLVDHAPVSGINGVPWDAVELPSQFMENWCWNRATLDLIARHHRTGASLPDELFDKLSRARNFQAGLQMVRQLEFALFDFRLHAENRGRDSADLQSLLDEVRGEIGVVPAPEWNRFQHSFAHVFAGGYAAGYYSYKWAEVLSADAFSRFEETGIFDPDTGRQFLHAVLEQGGARDPMELFIEFRGRKPSIEPLLRHSGIAGAGMESGA